MLLLVFNARFLLR